jgi:hypothetical protein
MHPLPEFSCRHFAPQTSEYQTVRNKGINGDRIPEIKSVMKWDSTPCKIKLLVCSVPNGRGLPVSTNATRMILGNEPMRPTSSALASQVLRSVSATPRKDALIVIKARPK